MLVLSRTLNQSIMIGESVEIYVVGVSPKSVDLVVFGLPGKRFQQIPLQVHEVANISQDISLTLIHTRDGKARLGIEGPRHLPIHRGELFTG